MITVKKVVFSAVLINLSLLAFSQRFFSDPDYGADSTARLECAKQLSTMSEFVKIKVYDYAYSSWRWCFKNCPASSKNIYIMGAQILKDKIENLEDETLKLKYLDTLMILYDQRIQHFDQEGIVLGKKGIDLVKYNRDAVEQGYGILKKSVELSKSHVEEATAVTFMQSSNVLFRSDKISADDLISDYIMVSEYLNQEYAHTRDKSKTQMAIDNVESIFSESGAADCNSLIKIFGPKYETSSKDIDYLKKVTDLFEKTKCEDTELFAKCSENLYALEPSAKAGYNLARLFIVKENYPKAADYLKKSIEQEKDSKTKAEYYYQLGFITQAKLNNNVQAKDYALEAIKLNPNYGDAYILIGTIYANVSKDCGSSDFEHSAVFWAAVDKFEKAKAVDPSVTDEANKLINRYSQYFPNNEDAFFNGFTDGQSYKIACWINETTTVRTQKR